ncbi:ATP-binding protein (plasmid) [Burkholderia glumae]|uniref:ATP-binding protein n=1 Tax=Burkholderia glumae TaxID=337 RepID=A0ABY5BFE3_BURGL|nr:ATP-binding protein [Burkholderia glumae]USS44301.1 ATP-binding protein [Burkholderia glumae]
MLEVLETLLGEEFTTRETRRIRMALQTARLGTIKTLAATTSASSEPGSRSHHDACATRVHRTTADRSLPGAAGAGKSHLSIALGVEAVRAGKSVYFGSLAEIVNSMAKAEREGKLGAARALPCP